MRNLTLTTALLLCSFSWISVSVSEYQTVEVQSGEEVTLLCSNFSSSPIQIIWFRAAKRSNLSCIAFMFKPLEPASFCDGFQNGKFEMSSNISTLFLKIKQVDSSDSGLYFCGYYISKNPLIADATYLEVQEECDGIAKLTRVILGAVTVFLMMVVICLAVKNRKLQKAANEEQHPQRQKNLDSDGLKDAALSLYPTAIRSRRPASEREVETHVIYSASR